MGNLGRKIKKGGGQRSRDISRLLRGSGKELPSAAYLSDGYKDKQDKVAISLAAWLGGSLILSHGSYEDSMPKRERAANAQKMIAAAAKVACGPMNSFEIKAPNATNNSWVLKVTHESDNQTSETEYSSVSLDDVIRWSLDWINSKPKT